ncbi:MAG: hypothetical protein ABH950_03840 [Candidatus Altiarchaeota archaeon]
MTMKVLNLYEIRDRARTSGRSVYTTQQLAQLLNKPRAIVNVYASRLVEKGLATRALRGRISFTDDDFVVASQLFEPAYVSMTSALNFHNIITQVPAYVECVSPKNSRRYEHLGIIYHKIPPSLFFGYEKHKKSESYAFVATPEKALIDWVYLNQPPPSIIDEIRKNLNDEKLQQYIDQFSSRGSKKIRRWLE